MALYNNIIYFRNIACCSCFFSKHIKCGPALALTIKTANNFAARHLISQKTVKGNTNLVYYAKTERRKRELKMKFSMDCSFAWGSRAKLCFSLTYNAEMNFIDFICSIFQFLLMPGRDASLPQTLSPRWLPGGRPFHFALVPPPQALFQSKFLFFLFCCCVVLSRILILMLVIVATSTEVFSLFLHPVKEGYSGLVGWN